MFKPGPPAQQLHPRLMPGNTNGRGLEGCTELKVGSWGLQSGVERGEMLVKKKLMFIHSQLLHTNEKCMNRNLVS